MIAAGSGRTPLNFLFFTAFPTGCRGCQRGECSEPIHSLGTAEKAGAAVVFLMTNGWMNGAVLNVAGGSRLV
jgi:NAD(P)-dependent dehydrogenase (short-subunit alcohol dehydrogenase family)